MTTSEYRLGLGHHWVDIAGITGKLTGEGTGHGINNAHTHTKKWKLNVP